METFFKSKVSISCFVSIYSKLHFADKMIEDMLQNSCLNDYSS